jgi:hypothetical protein
LYIRGFILLAALAALASGCGPGTESGGQEEGASVVVVKRSPSDVTTKIVGATPQQREILVDALAGIGETKLEVIEVVPAEKGWSDDPDAVGLEFPTDKGLDMYSEWQGWLVAQVLAIRAGELQLPEVGYVGDGEGGASVVGSADPKGRRHSDEDAHRIAQEIETAAEKVGASVDEIRILRPRGLAVSITLQVSDPAEFLDRRFRRFDPFRDLRVDAERNRHLRVVDSHGNRIVELAGAWLGGGTIGTGWVRPDLIGCYDPALSRPSRWNPPPCPSDPERSKPDVKDQPPVVSTKIVGATPKQEALLREILAGLAPTLIDEVRIAPARPPWTPYKPDSVIVSVRYADSPEKERGEWEALLLAQAFATRSRLTGLQPVAGYKTASDGAALDGPEEPEPDTRRPIDENELIEALSNAALSSGAKILDVRTVKPMNLAAVLILQVDAPASYLKHQLEGLMRSLPSGVRYDGLYIRIVDREGRFVWLSASTDGESISTGAAWARKDLRGCDPTPRFGGPDDPEPPPCPVD